MIDVTGYSEDTLVEQPAIALFAELGYETLNCFNEKFGLRDPKTINHPGVLME